MRKLFALLMAAIMLLSLILSLIPTNVSAASSSEIKKQIADSALDLKKEIQELKDKVKVTDIQDRAPLFAQIDKLEKELAEAKYKAMSSSSELTERCRESHLLKMLQANNDSLIRPSELPPYKINIPEE